MPIFWLAVAGALALLVRRTWKSSRRRRQVEQPAAPSDEEVPEAEQPLAETDEASDRLEADRKRDGKGEAA